MAAPYAVLTRLSRGGMGVVDLGMGADGQQVALKRLALYGSATEMARARQRVRREAEVLRRLDHPAIVPLLDVIDDGDDMVLVFPFLSGGNLAERVAYYGVRPPEEVAAIADHLLDALAAAHRAGVVHRDVKPANVLFAGDGRPLLADFGVARGPDATPGLTAADLVVGTPGYMSPEQARGEPATAASDVFSLGATLAFAATGRTPFGDGEPQLLMYRAAKGRITPLPRSLPAPLRRRLMPMLEPRPERRPSAAAARGGPAGTWARTANGWKRAQTKRRRSLVLVAAAILALAVGAVAFAAGRSDDNQRATATALAPPSSVATTTCTPLTYQPCGRSPAAFTDGSACVADHADYDGDATNGCEAAPDHVDGSQLGERLTANIVPAADVDEYSADVSDHYQFTCNGTVSFTLTAPAGITLRLDIVEDGKVVERAVSADGQPGVARVRENSCGSDDSTVLLLRVTPIGSDRTATPYTLTRAGSF
jgi:hypothetical protein